MQKPRSTLLHSRGRYQRVSVRLGAWRATGLERGVLGLHGAVGRPQHRQRISSRLATRRDCLGFHHSGQCHVSAHGPLRRPIGAQQSWQSPADGAADVVSWHPVSPRDDQSAGQRLGSAGPDGWTSSLDVGRRRLPGTHPGFRRAYPG